MSIEDQTMQWGMKGEKMLKPKSKGSGIMVFDFIDEHNGFLALSDKEHDRVRHRILVSTNTLLHSWSMERARRVTGPGTNLWFRCTERSRLQKYNTRRRRDGVTCGYLITVAAMPSWLTPLLKLAK